MKIHPGGNNAHRPKLTLAINGEGKCQRSQAGNAYDQEVGRVYDIGVLAGITGHSLLLKAQRVR